jgi:hypothetical protein
LTVVDPVECSDDVAAVPPSIPLDPDFMASLSAEEARTLQHLMDRAKDIKKSKEPKAVIQGDPLADLEEELACHFGMRKDCLSCDD